MPVCRDIAFKIDPAKLLRSEGNTDNHLIVQSAIWAAQSAKKLARPALIYRFLPCALEEKRLSVGGIFLNIGPMTHLLKHARQVAVGVATVGKGIEKQVRQLQSQNKMLQSYLLGSAAFAALDAAALHLKTLVEQNARRQKWGVGPALSPGALPGWPTSEQKAFGTLVDVNKVDVEITAPGLLLPRYSLSLLIGMGPNYKSRKVESTCGYCSLNKSCVYRNRSEPNPP